MFTWLFNWLRPTPPTPQVQIDGLGTLRRQGAQWFGEIPSGGETLQVSCPGDGVGPDVLGLARLLEVWRDRARYFARAAERLREHEPDSDAGDSTPFGISIEPWDSADCAVELLAPDEETLWRVAFQGDTAIAHSFDH